MFKVSRIAKYFVAAIAIGSAATAAAQNYPNRAIRFIVATSAGATADSLARVIGQEMSKTLGQPIVIENKPGAQMLIALEHIARGAPPDGYTVGVTGTDAMALLQLIVKDLRFDPMKDIVPIAGLADARYVLIGSVARPYQNFQELVAWVRANPGKLNYGSSAPQTHFPTLVVVDALKLNVVHIPYNAGGPYLQAIAAGTIDIGIAGEGSGAAMGDKVRYYAVTGDKRLAKMPNVPTFNELGFPGAKGPAYALTVRTGTPKEAVDKLAAAAEVALNNNEVKVSLTRLLFEIVPDKQDVAVKKLAEQSAFFTNFAQKIGLKPQ